MGDDGIGAVVVARLGRDSRLPADTEVAEGGSDLLACGELLHGRARVLLVDAVEALAESPGDVVLLDPWSLADMPAGSERTAGAHSLGLPAALSLLACADPSLRRTDLRLLGVAIDSARIGAGLSPDLERAVGRVVDAALAVLAQPR
jgi:hydrogenase maturation protease